MTAIYLGTEVLVLPGYPASTSGCLVVGTANGKSKAGGKTGFMNERCDCVRARNIVWHHAKDLPLLTDSQRTLTKDGVVALSGSLAKKSFLLGRAPLSLSLPHSNLFTKDALLLVSDTGVDPPPSQTSITWLEPGWKKY